MLHRQHMPKHTHTHTHTHGWITRAWTTHSYCNKPAMCNVMYLKAKRKHTYVCTHAIGSWECLPLLAYYVSHLPPCSLLRPHNPCSWPVIGCCWKASCYLNSKQLSKCVFVRLIKTEKTNKKKSASLFPATPPPAFLPCQHCHPFNFEIPPHTHFQHLKYFFFFFTFPKGLRGYNFVCLREQQGRSSQGQSVLKMSNAWMKQSPWQPHHRTMTC